MTLLAGGNKLFKLYFTGWVSDTLKMRQANFYTQTAKIIQGIIAEILISSNIIFEIVVILIGLCKVGFNIIIFLQVKSDYFIRHYLYHLNYTNLCCFFDKTVLMF